MLVNAVFIIRWAEPESNRRHKDFQSFALPTELSARIQLKAGIVTPNLSARPANRKRCDPSRAISLQRSAFKEIDGVFPLRG